MKKTVHRATLILTILSSLPVNVSAEDDEYKTNKPACRFVCFKRPSYLIEQDRWLVIATQKLQEQFSNAKIGHGFFVTYDCTVEGDGRITRPVLVNSSGQNLVDKSISEWLKSCKVAPLHVLQTSKMTVRMTFNHQTALISFKGV